ncbi:hypothetical protein DRJ16_03700 [Candidatus Woesearchaeota archaeon]|nr:MAG: hypothetical protein DRJ16_03700 [Candidatus Woesearchaeota archaeon]
MKTLGQVLKEIKETWDSFPHYVKATEKGMFGPSTASVLAFMFEDIKENAKKENQNLEGLVFLDFGSGSGLVLAFALAYGIGTVIGIEYDRELYELSKEYLARTFKDDSRLILINGDYLNQATYQHPIFSSNSFENFIFYNYDDHNLKKLFPFWLNFFKGDGTFYCATFFDYHAYRIAKALIQTNQEKNHYKILTHELDNEVLLVIEKESRSKCKDMKSKKVKRRPPLTRRPLFKLQIKF